MNTVIILATQMADNQNGNFVAKFCADYSVTVSGVKNGDWYLPSKYELNLLIDKTQSLTVLVITPIGVSPSTITTSRGTITSAMATRANPISSTQIMSLLCGLFNNFTSDHLFFRKNCNRYSMLQKVIPDISKQTLTNQMRELETDGVIDRIIYPEIPLMVVCSITP